LRVRTNPEWSAALAEAEQISAEVWRADALATIKRAMPKHWVAAMTFLERRYPNEFALRTVNRNLNSTDQPVGDRVSEDQLRRYSALMEDFRKENEAKTPTLPATESATG
jgi:hypothetical protein